MEKIKKELDTSDKDSQSITKNNRKGKDAQKKKMDISKKNGCSRKVKQGNSKKIADSSIKMASVKQKDKYSSSGQRRTESKTKSATAEKGKQSVVLEKQKIKTTKEKGTPVKKEELKLRPSKIRYSQSSISNQFTDGTDIGHLLDDIYFGRCFASAIPQIEVSQRKGKWVSADNRRLWVFKQLEVLGKIDSITVKVSKKIYSGKLTSENGGRDIEIRGADPSGTLFPLINCGSQKTTKAKRRRRRKNKTDLEQKIISSTPNNGDRLESSKTCASGIGVSQHTIDNEFETLHQQHNRFCSDTDNEDFALYDSYESTDDDVTDDCSLKCHNSLDNYWQECEKLQKNYEIEKVFDEYSESFTSSDTDEPEFSDNLNFTTDLDEFPTNQRYHDYSRKEKFSHFDVHVHDRWNICDDVQEIQECINGQKYYTDLCGRRECSRCSRMIFYREMDKGYYYEPPCQYVTAGYRPHQQSVTTRNNNVSKQSDNSSIISEISRGLEKFVGFFNELFR